MGGKNYRTTNQVLQDIAHNIVNLTIFTTPYTLPLINAMPPLSTNVIDDDDTSSSAISELNSD